MSYNPPYDALVPELREDPEGIGYAQLPDAAARYDALIRRDRPGPWRTLTPQEVYDALTVAEIAAIEAAALDGETPEANQAALAWLGYCSVAQVLDLTEGKRWREVLDGLAAQAIVSAESLAAVLALASASPSISRWDEIGTCALAVGNVDSAWRIINA